MRTTIPRSQVPFYRWLVERQGMHAQDSSSCVTGIAPVVGALGIEDILHHVCDHLASSGSDIASLRLTCRHFESIASPYLFQTLRLGARVRYLRRLKRVAADERFSRGVREIVWDTATYGYPEKFFEAEDVTKMLTLGDATMQDIQAISEQEMVNAAKYAQGLASDEHTIFRNPVVLIKLLRHSFRKLTGLESLVFTTWSTTGRAFFDLNAILGRKGLSPPPFRTLYNGEAAFARQQQSMLTVFGALYATPATIRFLDVSASSNVALRGADHLHFSGLLMDYRTIGHITSAGDRTACLRRLKTLSLNLED